MKIGKAASAPGQLHTTRRSTIRRGPPEGQSQWSKRAVGCHAVGGAVVREVLSSSGRTKLDGSSDREFYALPRLVKHVDDGFLAQLTQLYRERIPAGVAVLDLMSSWVSHLPPEARYSRVVGHGMSAAELSRNIRLDEFFVRDLNQEPTGWAAADQSYDAVLCAVSVQYLQQPEKVFAEIYRVLRPGGIVIISFSNRMFYTKAVAAWRDTSDFGRVQLVKGYFSSVEGFTSPEAISRVVLPSGPPGLQLPVFLAPLSKLLQPAYSDPFFALVAYRNFKPIEDPQPQPASRI